jgi:RimJ/RimL family protein N-acetyltransferase
MTAIAGRWQLRAFTPDDTAALTAAFTDPEIARWGVSAAFDGDVEAWWTKRLDDDTGTHWSRAIATADGALAGQVSLFDLDHVQGSGDIGYFVLPGYRRQGVARWAVAVACAQAFGALGLHRLQLYHAVDNVGSCAVARTNGFAQEGTLRQSYRYGDGAYHDEHLHARLASD